MANSTTGNPWVLDTAATISKNLIFVQSMEYHPNATDNDLLVSDNGGSVVWKARATAGAPNSEGYGVMKWEHGPMLLDGFVLTTIDAGYLYVYLQ